MEAPRSLEPRRIPRGCRRDRSPDCRPSQKPIGRTNPRPLDNNPCKITAGNPWQTCLVHLSLHVLHVARIDRGRLDLYEHFARRGNWPWQRSSAYVGQVPSPCAGAGRAKGNRRQHARRHCRSQSLNWSALSLAGCSSPIKLLSLGNVFHGISKQRLLLVGAQLAEGTLPA